MMKSLVLLLVVAACGDDAQPSTAGVLVRTDPAGAQCPHGGSVISSGLDANHNAVLEDSEIQVRTPVCNAASDDPAPVVSRLAAEPAGAHCADGGTAIETGLDTNGNGVLDDGEVTHTDYVCGEVLLTRLAPAPSCAAGGVAIEIGRDRDHDGELSNDEVEHTEISCGDVLNQSVNISSTEQAAALADIVFIHGDLHVTNGSVTLPKLQAVTGRLDIGNLGVRDFVAPRLESVTGEMTVLSTQLASLSLPKLAHVGGNFRAELNGALTEIALPALASIAGDLTITDHSRLAAFTAPLEHIGGHVVVRSNTVLGALSLQLLAAPIDVEVTNSGLATFQLSVSGETNRRFDVELTTNAKLTSASLSAVRIGNVFISGAPLLAALTVHASDAVDALTLNACDALEHITLTGRPNTAFHAGSMQLAVPVATLDLPVEGVSVTGSLSVRGTRLTTLNRFSTNVLLASDNTALAEITPMSVRSFNISNNPVLTSIALLNGSLHGLLQINNNPVLADVLLHDVTNIDGTLEVRGNPKLTSLRIPLLTDVSNALEISQNPLLATLELPSLFHIEDKLEIFGTALTTLHMPALVSGDLFFIEGNDALAHLDLPALSQVRVLEISGNPHLATCEVDALFAHVSGSHTQEDNDPTGTCTP